MLDNKNELVQYGSRTEVASLADRIKIMVPGGDKLSKNEALALAQVALGTQLNPFLGEVWYIPGKGPMVGIKGARRLDLEAVQKKGGYTNMELIACDPLEAGATAEQVKANEIAAAFRCEISDSVSSREYQTNLLEVIRELRAGGEPDPVKAAKDICGNRPITMGWGFSTVPELSKMGKTALARKRAEADALKKRIDIPFGASVAAADMQSEDVVEAVARDPEPLAEDKAAYRIEEVAVNQAATQEEVHPLDVVFPPVKTTMSLETAVTVKNKEGVAYGDLPTDKLSFMANALVKSKDEQDMMKLDAIKIILASRTS